MNGFRILTIIAAIVIGIICINLIVNMHIASAQLEDLEGQVAQLQTQLATTKMQNAGLSENLLALQQENTKMAQTIIKLEDESQRLSGYVVSLHKDNNRLRQDSNNICTNPNLTTGAGLLQGLLERLLGILGSGPNTL